MADQKVYPMRLYATWEVDRASNNSIPRLCFVAFNRLTVVRNLEPDTTSLVIAVKLQGYKRTLRSNDIGVAVVNGIIDIDLDITFTLQYPHVIKKKCINLFVMLQRRKKYKTRAILGFKTLAVGVLNLNQVLQSSATFIRELSLFSESDKTNPAAKLYLSNASTQPLEPDDAKVKVVDHHAQYDTDEDDEDSSANEAPSESELLEEGGQHPQSSTRTPRRHGAKSSKFAAGLVNRRQKNLKQKFVALLKKFKISEEALETDESVSNYCGEKPTQREIDALFEELENLSDSAPECDADAVSVKSAPKPGLRPYFNSTNTVHEKTDLVEQISEDSKESADSQTANELDTTDQELSDVGAAADQLNASSQQPLLTVNPLGATAATKSKEFPLPAKQPACLVHSYSDKKKRTDPKRQTSAEFGRAATGGGEKTFLDKLGGHHVSTSATKLRLPAALAVATCKDFLAHRPVPEQLAANFSADAAAVPDAPIVLVSAADVSAQNFVSHLQQKSNMKVFVLSVLSDVRLFFNALINRVQRFCNVNAVHPRCVKVVPIGGDKFVSFCLRVYVECFSPKPNEFVHFVRFFIVSPSNSTVGRYLCSVDPAYNQLFGAGVLWREWWDSSEVGSAELNEISSRIGKFVSVAKLTVNHPIAEVMLQLKDKNAADEDSTQIFVPFVGEVRLGLNHSCGELFRDNASWTASPQGSASKAVNAQQSLQTEFSPPGSPHLADKGDAASKIHSLFCTLVESQELQIEYWATTAGQGSSAGGSNVSRVDSTPTSAHNLPLSAKKDSASNAPPTPSSLAAAGYQSIASKFSLKSAFRSLCVTKWPTMATGPFLTLNFVREKKRDKVLLKFGMKTKEKDNEQKRHTIENVSRLICSTRQHTPMTLFVDGVQWDNVKFFQVSTQWQTHVKVVPIARFTID